MKIMGVNVYLFVLVWVLVAFIGYLFLIDAPRLEKQRLVKKKRLRRKRNSQKVT